MRKPLFLHAFQKQRKTALLLVEVKDMVTRAELRIIEEYNENRDQRRRREEEAIKTALEALKPIVEANRAYLRYAQAQGWFKMTEAEEQGTALHNALTSVIGRAINFEIGQAEKLVFEILQDVNAHTQARQVAKLLGLKLKPHELE